MKKRLSRKSEEHFAYGSVIEALSFGLYPDKRHVLREFVQNAFDASVSWKDESDSSLISPIEIKIEPPSIFIADRGIGMQEDEVNKYRYLGYSEKDRLKKVGFRGIGKDSGLAVAKKIILTTSKYGISKLFTVTIDAEAMLDEIKSQRNPPLEEVLRKHSEITGSSEDKRAHYTFVELHQIRKDAQILFSLDKIKDYLQRNCPVPFDPNFSHGVEIENRLRENVHDYYSIDILLNGVPLYKPFPINYTIPEKVTYTRPEYEPIFADDEVGSSLIAYCWYCGHSEKGQFDDRENSGLIYRVKNFAIGDRHLSRKTLWNTTPERAFYFFGEIHVLDDALVPSADRGDFEDNGARNRLYVRGRRIAQVLSQKAGTESAQRRFEEKTLEAEKLVDQKEKELNEGILKELLKPDVNYQIRKSVEDLEKRLQQTEGKRRKTVKDQKLIEQGSKVVTKAKTFIRKLEQAKATQFYSVDRVLKLNEEAKRVYQVIATCLRKEFQSNPELLERIMQKIDNALMEAFAELKL